MLKSPKTKFGKVPWLCVSVVMKVEMPPLYSIQTMIHTDGLQGPRSCGAWTHLLVNWSWGLGKPQREVQLHSFSRRPVLSRRPVQLLLETEPKLQSSFAWPYAVYTMPLLVFACAGRLRFDSVICWNHHQSIPTS